MSWVLLLFLLTASGLYLGGARQVVAGPAFLAGAGLWILLGVRAIEGLRSGKRVFGLIDMPIFLFLGYAAWAVLRAPCEYFGRVEWLWAAVYGAVFLTARHQLPGRLMIPWLLGWFLLVAVITTGFGFLHFRIGVYPIGPVPWLDWPVQIRPNYAERMSGTFGCPNHFGNYLVQASLAALTLVIWPDLAWPLRVFAGWAAAACAGGVFFSISRGSWIAWVAGHGVWLLRWLRRGPLNWLGRGLVVLFAAALVGGGFLAARGDAAIAKRWQLIFGKGVGWERIFSGEGEWRLALAKDGLAIWQKAPWFGHGPASFDLQHLRVSTWPYGSRAFLTHNDYVNTLCDYGAVGAFLVVLFWIFLAVFLWRRTRTRGKESKADVCTGLGWALMATMLAHAFVDFNYHVPAPAISCFFLLGLATTISWPERREAGARWANPLLLVLALTVGGLTAWQGWQTWAGWRSLPEKPEEAAKLSHSELDACAQQAERSDPRSPNLASILGDAYRLKLLEVYFAPPSTSPSARALRIKEEARLAESALQWYCAAAQRSPQDDTFGVRQASILDLQGKYEEAGVLYRQGLEQRPHSTFFHLSYGNHLWRKGDLAEAKVELEKAVSLGDGGTRPADEKNSETEAREMLAQLKEQIAKGPTIRQGKKFNPQED